MSLSETVLKKLNPQDKLSKLADSAGLYLLVKPNGSKLCDNSRAELAQGNDPGQTRRDEKQTQRLGKSPLASMLLPSG